jgi:N-glycosidase YbiA
MIDAFRGKYRFLSNFAASPVMYQDETYPTVEHAYQAAKTDDRILRMAIRYMPTAAAAKKAGSKIPRAEDWFTKSLQIMEYLVYQKFAWNPELKALLLATGDKELVEGNTWGDTFWGVCRGKGSNELGKILMRVRAQLRLDLVM